MNTMTRPENTIAQHQQNHALQSSDVMMSDELMNRMMQMADVMAKSKVTVPKHLQGSQGDCFAVVLQAAQWGMNPFSVAQKTHLVNGTLGYEAQLVNAVITTRAPVTGRLKFEFGGDWDKVNGKEDKSPDRFVIVSATFKGEDEPRELKIGMHQVGAVRNSPMWTADPRQQLAYLAVKRWSRLYCPDVILGVYTPDEIEPETPAPERDVTEQVVSEPKKHAGSSALKDRLNNTRSKKQDSNVVEGQATQFDVVGTLDQINAATTLDQLSAIASHVPANIGEPAKTDIKSAYRKRKAELTPVAAPTPEPEVVPMPEPVATSPMMPRESVDAVIAEMKNAQNDDDLTQIWNTRVNPLIDSIEDGDFEDLDVVYASRGAELNA